MVKVTFTLDEQTVRRIESVSERLRLPKSQVIRDAIAEYHARADRLSEVDRLRMLSVLDQMGQTPPPRPGEEVDREIRSLRAARRRGGRRSRT